MAEPSTPIRLDAPEMKGTAPAVGKGEAVRETPEKWLLPLADQRTRWAFRMAGFGAKLAEGALGPASGAEAIARRIGGAMLVGAGRLIAADVVDEEKFSELLEAYRLLRGALEGAARR